MCTPWATPLVIAPRLGLWPAKPAAVKPGEPGPALDDQRDRIGVYRVGPNPVAVGNRLSPGAFWDTGRRPALQAAEPRASVIAAAASQASSATTGQSAVGPEAARVWYRERPGHFLAPRQKQLDAVGVARDVLDHQFGDLARPQRRGKPTSESARSRNPGSVSRITWIAARKRVKHEGGLYPGSCRFSRRVT